MLEGPFNWSSNKYLESNHLTIKLCVIYNMHTSYITNIYVLHNEYDRGNWHVKTGSEKVVLSYNILYPLQRYA